MDYCVFLSLYFLKDIIYHIYYGVNTYTVLSFEGIGKTSVPNLNVVLWKQILVSNHPSHVGIHERSEEIFRVTLFDIPFVSLMSLHVLVHYFYRRTYNCLVLSKSISPVRIFLCPKYSYSQNIPRNSSVCRMRPLIGVIGPRNRFQAPISS